MNTKQIAQQALQISQTGKLPTNKGEINFSEKQKFAELNTILYRPNDLVQLSANDNQIGYSNIKISVNHESEPHPKFRCSI